MKKNPPPVIALDGFAGSGKGTTRSIVAAHLGFHELDSGVLYRAVALKSKQGKRKSIKQLVAIAASLKLKFKGRQVFLDGRDETEIIRSDRIGKPASVIAQIPEVRMALRDFQLNMRKLPGLVADGRDQGEIFDDSYRFFLETPAEIRAERRVKEFKAMNQPANYAKILAEIKRRDDSDINRKICPLRPHPRAWIIDTRIPAESVADIILRLYAKLSEERLRQK